jgi:hypothetical protein
MKTKEVRAQWEHPVGPPHQGINNASSNKNQTVNDASREP